MLTQCPSCQTTFRVTTEILRVADGQVRCGRCQTQFDALERLMDENESSEQSGRYARSAAAPASQAEVDEAAAQEDITLERRPGEISDRYRIPDAGGRSPRVQQETVEEWVEIDEVDEAADAVVDVREEFADDSDDVDELAAAAAEQIEPEQEQAPQDYAPPRRARLAAAGLPDIEAFTAEPARSAAAPIWKIMAAPLALLLAIQLLHSYRHTLARHPRLGPAITSVYGTFGATLQPDWNLHAYEILQWHVGSDPATPGTLKVRASLKNTARFAQPYPLLKLILEDRWGERVREREFEPAEYLDAGTAAERFLAPGQQANATISIVDPGPDAEGFRFDVCLRGAHGPVCAADVPRRSN